MNNSSAVVVGVGERGHAEGLGSRHLWPFSETLLLLSGSKLKLSVSWGESETGRAQNWCLTMSGAELCGPDKACGGWRLGNMLLSGAVPREGQFL